MKERIIIIIIIILIIIIIKSNKKVFISNKMANVAKPQIIQAKIALANYFKNCNFLRKNRFSFSFFLFFIFSSFLYFLINNIKQMIKRNDNK